MAIGFHAAQSTDFPGRNSNFCQDSHTERFHLQIPECLISIHPLENYNFGN
jgi:hypothetical protein